METNNNLHKCTDCCYSEWHEPTMDSPCGEAKCTKGHWENWDGDNSPIECQDFEEIPDLK